MLSDELTRCPGSENGESEGGQTKTIKRPYRLEQERLKSMDLDGVANVCARIIYFIV